MRIVSWNIQAGGGKRQQGIFEQLVVWQPDVIALSEFRGTPASQQLREQLAKAGWGYQVQTIDEAKRVTNALLTASRFPLTTLAIPGAPNQPRRWLAVRVGGEVPFSLVNMHIPNYNTGFKYPYLAAVLEVMGDWANSPAIFIGDTNCGKSYIDDETGVFWWREHEWMEAIEALGWVDAFRQLQGDKRVYSWYSHKNNGFRLDQAFLNPAILPALRGMRYEWGVSAEEPKRREGLSDHAAILLDLDWAK